ncbi:nucleoside-diphosphate sugar epimerase/dehydratase [Aliiroseovarius crassostreae]|uniref:nucleoside-diphosphate sugar epimerase/dehydratase n=1 Tax=Aliiroseovarius crassostreae TaxID=154981 RepID=UPI003C79967E
MIHRSVKLLGPDEYAEGFLAELGASPRSETRIVGLVDPSQRHQKRMLAGVPVYNSVLGAFHDLHCSYMIYDDTIMTLAHDLGAKADLRTEAVS